MRLTSGESTDAPFEYRLNTIELLRAEAGQLLTTVTEQALQQQLHLALRNLDEAETWISSNNNSPSIIVLIDLLLELAASRTRIVADTVRAYGPDVTTIGK